MKTVIRVILILSGLFGPCAWGKVSIEGSWQFVSYIYRGERHPPMNPNLVLTFEFHRDGTSRVSWYRKGEKGFCDRRGTYSWDGEILTDKITWVNPANAASCAQDPDMQLGRETQTRLEHWGHELHLILGIADEPFVYVLRPTCFNF